MSGYKTICQVGSMDEEMLQCEALKEWQCCHPWLTLLVKSILWLLCLGTPRIYCRLGYMRSVFDEATHVRVRAVDGRISVVELVRVRTKPDDRSENSTPNRGETKRFIPSRELSSTANAQGTYQSTVPSILQADNAYYFIYNNVRYFWDETEATFKMFTGLDNMLTPEQVYLCSKGLDEQERARRLGLMGTNVMQVAVPRFWQLFFSGLTDPFYVIQIVSIIIWSTDNYYIYASVIFLVLIITLTINTRETIKNLRKLHNMVYVSLDVKVQLADGSICLKSSEELVPGDIIVVPQEGSPIPCDCVLVSGSCVVNESMLTGECFPTRKVALPARETLTDDTSVTSALYSSRTHRTSTLFCGTTVSQVQSYHLSNVLAMVVNTGFSTYKGGMIRSVMFPSVTKFAFFRDSLRFMAILFFIAVIGVGYCIYIFYKLHFPASDLVRKSLDVVTILVPPGLPAALAIATIYSVTRLNRAGITCIDNTRINLCGKIKMFCFDKTGTLTEETLNISGFLTTITDNENICNFSEDVCHRHQLPCHARVLECMASCHSLLHTKEGVVGDPMDMAMFNYCGWTMLKSAENNSTESDHTHFSMPSTLGGTVVKGWFPSSPDSSHSTRKLSGNINMLSIVKTYQFESELQRMTVVTKNLIDERMVVYSKGSPEAISRLCIPATVPVDLKQALYEYAGRGYRVIAMAYKCMGDGALPWHKIMKLERNDYERDLIFIGFILFHNELKEQSKEVVCTLSNLGTRMCMVTGDNMLTALSIGCECGIVSVKQPIFQLQAQLVENNKNDQQDTPSDLSLNVAFVEHKFETFAAGLRRTNSSNSVMSIDTSYYSANGSSNHNLKQLVIDGASFQLIADHGDPELLNWLLVSGVVFSRMSPQQKTQLVKYLQNLGYVVAMVGDGANDCGALKAAHAGIALASSEASVVAPFSTKYGCLSAVLMLLSEGRTSLDTAFSVFKFIIMYSVTQFTSLLVLYNSESSFSDMQFLFIDLFMLAPVVTTMVNIPPASRLDSKRPLGRLAHPQVFFSLIGFFIIQLSLSILIVSMISKYAWFVAAKLLPDFELCTASMENTAVFCSLNFIYVFACVAVSVGPPHRGWFFCHPNYVLSIMASLFIATALLLYPGYMLQWTFSIVDIPSFFFRCTLFGVSIGFGFLSVLWEALVVRFQPFRRLINLLRFKRESRNRYKKIIEQIQARVDWPFSSTSSVLKDCGAKSKTTTL